MAVGDQRDFRCLVDRASSRRLVEGRWVLASTLSLGPVLFLCLLAFGTVLGRRAKDALEFNRRLTDQTWPRDENAEP